ncbi:MAG: hypothetical protein K2Q10_05475, partial [Rhodospirillales bacterium]|nr:hypothetical protein [Rhodospirillales bacterium]
QHLSQTLDQRMLGMIQDMGLRERPPAISLNTNVTTLFTPAFKNFEQWLADKDCGLIIELQVVDIFADLGAYFFARDWLKEHGHSVLLDGLTPLVLGFMDVGQYGADLFKINWSPELADGHQGGEIILALSPLGLDRAILGRCDSEAAIQWAMTHGITSFQGRYVDAMLAAVTMAGCDKSKACTFAQCIHRRSVIAGPPRGECGNLDLLDAFPEVKAPRRRDTGGAA